MFRSQVYLTEEERTQLQDLSSLTGRSQSELIREAIDHFIEMNRTLSKNKLTSIRALKGIWKKRRDLPDFASMRKEFDRNNEK